MTPERGTSMGNASRVLVLLYHRIGSPACDPWSMHVSEANFAAHLQVLADTFPVIPLDRLADGSWADLPDLSICLTFDDGYADNLERALPLLADAEVPATFFLVSGVLRSPGVLFWWDQLEELLLEPGVLPEDCQPLLGSVAATPFGAARHHTAEAATRSRQWRAWRDPAPGARQALFLEVWRHCRSLGAVERDRFLAALRSAAGVTDVPGESHRTLTAAEAQTLAASPFVSIGAHTRSHVRLSDMPAGDQAAEITGSRADLQDLGGDVRAFSYPFGGPDDYDAAAIAAVRAAGFSVACTNQPGLACKAADPLQLPRLFVHDWDADEFRRRVMASVVQPCHQGH